MDGKQRRIHIGCVQQRKQLSKRFALIGSLGLKVNSHWARHARVTGASSVASSRINQWLCSVIHCEYSISTVRVTYAI